MGGRGIMKLLVSALEHSANVHLKALVKEFDKDVELIGIFDGQLGSPLIDLKSLAIMGIVDALKKLRFFFKLRDRMVELAEDADKILLMDSSGFNLPLAKKLKKVYPDKEIIYYILPQAWAWRRGRIAVIEKTIDRILSILPFEKNYYPPGSKIEYVGHPLLDEITEGFKEKIGPDVKKVLFMPGSRRAEITRLMPVFKELRAQIDAEAILAIPDFFTGEQIDELYGDISGFNVTHDAHRAMKEADFGFICSGTATLEASLIGLPFILVFIAKKLDHFIGMKLLDLPYYGLANLMFNDYSGHALHPEFIQDEVTVENLMRAYSEFDREIFFENAKALRSYLKHGSSRRVAEIIES